MDNKPSFRTQKIELNIKRLVSEYLVTHRDYHNQFPNLRLEITSVKVSKDLRFAKIYLIHNISEAEFEIFTKKYQHEIQNVVARNLTSKYTPRVALIFDQTFSESLKVQSLLDSLS